ncbi:MAG: MBL fold metallo-hydrolase [Clostridia bacterium]|nr:MBL fold metallo-hydrolase [Clostridia bacterium]
MRVKNLGSGSKGNSTLIETGKTKVLLDCGFGIRELTNRLNEAGVSLDEIDAIVITHEHSDHIKGLKSIIAKHKIKVYAHALVWPVLHSQVDNRLEMVFGDMPFKIGDLVVTPFVVSHDSINCQGFTFTCGKAKFGYATDLGYVSSEVLNMLTGSKLVFIESNHDEEMLKNGPYPPILKARIRGNTGHLSNIQCAEATIKLALSGTKYFALAHLSEHNNTPALAYGTVSNALANAMLEPEKDVFLRLTYQDKCGNNFYIKET